MATSQCPKCESTSFELINQQPSGTYFEFSFIQCAGCATPVGVVESRNIGTLLHDQKLEIASLASRLSALESMAQQVLDALQEKRHS